MRVREYDKLFGAQANNLTIVCNRLMFPGPIEAGKEENYQLRFGDFWWALVDIPATR